MSTIRLNPEYHFPKSKRGRPRKVGRPKKLRSGAYSHKGRPAVVHRWKLTIYDKADNIKDTIIGHGTTSQAKLEAAEIASGRGIGRVVLDGPLDKVSKPTKKRAGRPKGSKNKVTARRRKGPGRPKGSKNKPKRYVPAHVGSLRLNPDIVAGNPPYKPIPYLANYTIRLVNSNTGEKAELSIKGYNPEDAIQKAKEKLGYEWNEIFVRHFV